MCGARLKISVIVPVYNDAVHLKACLAAVFQSVPAPFECIVVNDASTDDSAAVARTFPVILINSPENGGPARARNIAAARAGGDILCFIDSDVCIAADTLQRIEAVFTEDLSVDAIFGSYDTQPPARSFISQYKNLSHHFVHQQGQTEACTFWAGCGAVRTSVFRLSGGFDTSFTQSSVEDIELGMRLRQAGHRILLLKHLQVTHLKCWGFFDMMRTDLFRRGIPWTRLMLKHRHFPNTLNVNGLHMCSVLLVYLLIASFAVDLVFHRYHALILALSLLWGGVFIYINRALFQFFTQHRGRGFSMRVFPLHLLYFLNCGLGFGCGLAAHIMGRRFTALHS